jgi:hypothetical protein
MAGVGILEARGALLKALILLLPTAVGAGHMTVRELVLDDLEPLSNPRMGYHQLLITERAVRALDVSQRGAHLHLVRQ